MGADLPSETERVKSQAQPAMFNFGLQPSPQNIVLANFSANRTPSKSSSPEMHALDTMPGTMPMTCNDCIASSSGPRGFESSDSVSSDTSLFHSIPSLKNPLHLRSLQTLGDFLPLTKLLSSEISLPPNSLFGFSLRNPAPKSFLSSQTVLAPRHVIPFWSLLFPAICPKARLRSLKPSPMLAIYHLNRWFTNNLAFLAGSSGQ